MTINCCNKCYLMMSTKTVQMFKTNLWILRIISNFYKGKKKV